MTDEKNVYPIVTVYDADANKFSGIKKLWYKIKSSKLFLSFRHSRLNPYHTQLKRFDSKEEANKAGVAFYVDKRGVRRSAEFCGSINEEFERTGRIIRGNGDVSDRIPRDKDGKLDLMGEEPIVFAFVPVEGPSLVGHACMEYKDYVINRRSEKMGTDSLFATYGTEAEYYFVYPSTLGVTPKQVEAAMQTAFEKGKDKKYNLINNNCALAVSNVMKALGAKGIHKVMGVATPGNNPFNFGVKKWCRKYGVHVSAQEMRDIYTPRSKGERTKEQVLEALKKAKREYQAPNTSIIRPRNDERSL